VIEVVRQLGQLGHTVDLFVPAPIPPGLFRGEKGITIHVVPTIPLRIVRWLTFYTVSALLVIIAGWRTRPDVLYTREMVYNLFPPVISRLLTVPLVVEVNGFLLDEVALAGAGAIERGMIRFFQDVVFRRVDRIVAVSEGIKEWIIEEYKVDPERIAVIPNGTNPDIFSPLGIETVDERIGLPAGLPIVGFVGSCCPYHDVPLLIEAAVHIGDIRDDVRFVIAGDGYMRKSWMRLAEERGVGHVFLFTGRIPYEDVPHYINAFTVCAVLYDRGLSSRSVSPIKLYEYMACGRPIVGTDLKGVGDLLKTSGAGIAVPPDDPEALAEALLSLLSNKALCEEMGRRGRETVLTFYTWGRVAQDVAEVCRDRVIQFSGNLHSLKAR
jgi:glycosyltransferase involved in cell wall biosynthesis